MALGGRVLSVAARGAVTLIGVSIVVFLAIHLVPGGFADVYVPTTAPPSVKAAVIHRYGLDQPFATQYVRWIGAFITGDFGTSMVTSETVSDEVALRGPATAELALIATLLSLLLGIPLGLWAAVRGRGLAAGIARIGGAIGLSIPDFVVGSLFVFFFAAHPIGFTIGGYVSLAQNPLANLSSVLLPAVALSFFTTGIVMRTTRDSVLNVLTESHITSAVARGERTGQIIRRHVLRNSGIPVVTVTAVNLGYLLGGAVIVETIFSIPGLGQYAAEAVARRDYAVVQAVVLLAASAFVIVNTLTDLTYAFLDPRLRSKSS